MKTTMTTPPSHRRNRRALCAFVAAAAVTLACSPSEPQIVNTRIQPSTWAIGGIADTATFTVTTDLLHFGGDITNVEASVQGTNIRVPLRRENSILNGERWTGTTQLTLFRGLAEGIYVVSITASDAQGDTAVDENAASVTVTASPL